MSYSKRIQEDRDQAHADLFRELADLRNSGADLRRYRITDEPEIDAKVLARSVIDNASLHALLRGAERMWSGFSALPYQLLLGKTEASNEALRVLTHKLAPELELIGKAEEERMGVQR